MSSDLELLALMPLNFIVPRTRIEILFSVLKHVIGAFKFRSGPKICRNIQDDPFLIGIYRRRNPSNRYHSGVLASL